MKVQVYGKDHCQFCTKAMVLLTQLKLPFVYFKLDENFTREQLLERFPSARTFPQIEIIYDDDTESLEETTRYVGGYTELVEYFRQTGIIN